MADKLRIGIIGTGGIAHAHANAYKQFEDVEIVAGADIIPGKARKFLDEFGWTEATAYETHEELCARRDIDAVSICTYNSQHAAPCICALTSGKNVMLEKPLCVTLDEAKAIRAVEQATGKFVTVGFQPRYGANVKKVKEVIDSGVLGQIYYVVVGGGRVKGIPGRTFIEKDKAAVGAVGDIGCYGLDFALNSIGYPKPLSVSAYTSDFFGKDPGYYPDHPEYAEKFGVDDFAAGFIRLEGGIVLDFKISWAMHMDTMGDAIILGTKGGLRIPSTQCWNGEFDSPMTIYKTVAGKQISYQVPLEPMGELFYNKIRSFLDAIRTNGTAPVPTEQIIYNQAIIDGIVKSAELGKEIEGIF